MQRLEAYFPQNVSEIVLDGLTQWDKDVLLHVSGDEIPESFEIHIGYDGIAETFRFPLKKTDGVATVKIPNVLLKQTSNIKAWIYVVDAEGCRTVKTINIPMVKREKPAEYESSLDNPQKDVVEQLIENTNELVKTSADLIDSSKELQEQADEMKNSFATKGEIVGRKVYIKSTDGITYEGEIFNDYGNNTASSNMAHAEGSNTKATEFATHAEGFLTTASGYVSHAEGLETVASGSRTHAEGYQTTASGTVSHAEGIGSVASGITSHAEGASTQALDYAAHTEGYKTEAKLQAHAEGNSSKAYGDISHAEGYLTEANGARSHAEGHTTKANGAQSHAGGLGTIATRASQTAIGEYNAEDSNALFVVGNGTSDTDRSNAFVIKKDGSGLLNNKQIATEEYVDNFNLSNGSNDNSIYQKSEKDDTALSLAFTDLPDDIREQIAGTYNKETDTGVNATSLGTSISKGKRSFNSGSSNLSTGKASITNGADNYNGSDNGAVFGYANVALKEQAFCGGGRHILRDEAQTSGGHGNDLSGYASSGFGDGLKVNGWGQQVVGRYNVEDADAMFIVGNGTSDTDRSNAFAVYGDGSIKIGGVNITPNQLTALLALIS